jgi:hypothetical protein
MPPPPPEPLTQVEAYATASLFMLSLRETLWEANGYPGLAQRGLWGADGLCRTISLQLDVPERVWEARPPATAGQQLSLALDPSSPTPGRRTRRASGW